MKKRFGVVIVIITFLLVQTSCIIQYPAIHKPDMDQFKQYVRSVSLQDSLEAGRLKPGMPYFVVTQIFKDWTNNIKETKIPVPSLGSRQELKGVEGLGRKYHDPTIQVYLDKYKTKDGTLRIWYQKVDFYRKDIEVGDKLCVYLEDTTLCSPILYLLKSWALTVKDSFPQIPRNEKLYGEIHSPDNPRSKISYWYTLRIHTDGKTFLLKDLDFEIYPIEFMEFDKEKINSFGWR